MERARTSWIGAALLILSLVLAACSTAQPAPTPAPAQPTAAAEPTAAPTQAPEPTAAAEPTAAPTKAASSEEFVFGMVLVGPINDGGWNQAHYDAAKYVEAHVPGTKFIYIDKV